MKTLIRTFAAAALGLLATTAHALTDLTQDENDDTVTELITGSATHPTADGAPKNLFDNKWGGGSAGDDSRWMGQFGSGKTTYFTYGFKTATVVNAVRLRVPAWNCGKRAPKKWTIYGSFDNSGWTTIHEQTDANGNWAAQESRIYLFENLVAYKYYKIVVNEIHESSEGYAQLNEVEFYHLIRWTGAAEDGVLANPENWEGNQVPGADADVCFAGDAVPNIPADASFAVASVYAQNVTLADNLDWSGLSAPVDGKIDLNGHNLTVSQLAGTCTITDTSAAGSGGELHVNVAKDTTVNTSSVTLSGTLKVVKEGPGSLNFSKEWQSFKGGIDVVAGRIYTSAIPGNWPFGGNGTKSKDASIITVNEGARFDINGKTGFAYMTINLNGGLILGNSTQFNPTVKLLADSSLRATWELDTTYLKLDLNGHTLNVTIDPGNASIFLNFHDITYLTNGTFDVISGGTLKFTQPKDFSTVDFKVNGAISATAETSVHDYEWCYSSDQRNGGSAKLKVFGTFTPTTDCFYGPEMQNGSTMNLSTKTSAWSTTGTATSGNKFVSFANGAKVTVDVGERELHQGDKVFSWTTKPSGVTFRVVGTNNVLTDESAELRDDGLYYTADPDEIVTAVWTGAAEDGNVATRGNWACTNAVGNEAQDALPGAKATVYFSGALPAIASGAQFTAGRVVLSDAAELSDALDWSGLSAPVDGKIDLKGHDLTVSQLAGDLTITDSNAAGSGGELHVNVASDATAENTSVTLSGSLRLVKEGAGTFKATKTNQSYTGGTEVSAGTLVYGTNECPVGPKSSSVKVAAGATLNMNDKFSTTSCIYNYDLAGTVQQFSSGDGWGDAYRCFGDITLSGDATIIGKGYFFANPTKTPGLITFNGHTLTFDIVDAQGKGGYSAFGAWRDDGNGGTIKVLHGSFEGSKGYGCSSTRLVVSSAATFKVAQTFKVGGLEYGPNSWVSNMGTPLVMVYGQYLAGPMRPRLELQDGSTLDLSAASGVWSADGIAPANLPQSQSNTTYDDAGLVTFANGATVTVIPPDRLGKIIAWPSIPTGVTFKLASGIPGRLEVKEDGLYLRRGLIIVFQ